MDNHYYLSNNTLKWFLISSSHSVQSYLYPSPSISHSSVWFDLFNSFSIFFVHSTPHARKQNFKYQTCTCKKKLVKTNYFVEKLYTETQIRDLSSFALHAQIPPLPTLIVFINFTLASAFFQPGVFSENGLFYTISNCYAIFIKFETLWL